MQTGILSDTHNQVENLKIAIDEYNRRNIKTIIHCGDLTSPELVEMFKGFKLMMALGNCDTVVSQLKKKALASQVDAVFFSSYEGELEGRNIFITHGHEEGQIMDAVLTKRFEYIFYGHTHHQKDEMRGNSRLICPGALGGMKREVRSFGMIDFSTGAVEWVEIPGLV